MTRIFIPLAMTGFFAACSAADTQNAEQPVSESDMSGAANAESGQEADAETGTETLTTIPVAFQGHWDFAEDTCQDPNSEMRLNITADRITYYESEATPTAITATGENALTIDHQFSGEGDEWQETLGYGLSDDGERLTVTSPDGSMSIRIRCPS